jgi:hypothetical protein
MGIKFLCPNGHKLHVKAFLGGKKAICPKCGARVLVPVQDPSAADEIDPGPTQGETAVEAFESPPEQSTRSASAAVLSAAEHVLAARRDPIEEAPSAVWYVRPATGGQFGPASGEIMRAWIDEGRISASSLVWRAGWNEWRAASAIFPQLGAMLASPGVAVGPPTPVHGAGTGNGIGTAVPVNLPLGQVVQSVAPEVAKTTLPAASTVVPPLAQGLRKRRRNRDVSLIASAILLVIVVILVAVLVIVFRSQSSSGGTPSDEAVQSRQHSLPSDAQRAVAVAQAA